MKSAEEKLSDITQQLINIGMANDPIAFRGALMGVVANVIGHMPEEYFQQLIVVEPCGVPGCDCHLGLGLESAKFLKMLRADWEAAMKTTTTAE